MKFPTPIPFHDAIHKLGRREVTPSARDTVMWSHVAVALRERAFFSARVESTRMLQGMQDYLGDYLAGTRLPGGGIKAHSRAEFVADMRELAIREGLGNIDPATGKINPVIRDSDLTDIRSMARLQLIFDVQTEAAQSYGNWIQGMDPDTLYVFPAQRFLRVRPVMVPRKIHQAHQGEIRRKDDLEFWLRMNPDFNVPWGPWGFGSGMGVEDVDREEAIAEGVIGEHDVVRPVHQEFNDLLAASVKDLSPDLQEALRRATGGTVADGRLIPAATPSTTVAEALKIAGLDRAKDATTAQVVALLSELKEATPAAAAAKIKSIKSAQLSGQLSRNFITGTMQELLDMLPPSLVSMLPEIEVEVKLSITNALGSYNENTRKLLLNAGRLQDPAAARRTIYHELLHWIHDHGSQGYRDRVRTLFEQRTAGETIAKLAPYNSKKITGKRDKWADADGDEYAGRIYDWENGPPGGLEVVTRHLEKLSDPAELARHWNHAAADGSTPWRDAFIELLTLLY